MTDPARYCPPELEDRFAAARDRPSDINEHLDLLRSLASRCEHVTEFGMRGANGSTVALLAAQPSTLISWDINPFSVVSQTVADLLAVRGRTRFQPRVGNTLEIHIEQTELLFVDTWHTSAQLFAELERHGDPTPHHRGSGGVCSCRVTRYLAFHDTATFGMVGEDGKEPGLRLAIRKFQREVAFPLWRLVEDRPNNNGLVILAHV